MTDTTNQVAKSGPDWRMFAIYSGLDENESRAAEVLFVFEPEGKSGLRAKPTLLELPNGGQKLGFTYELTGVDKIAHKRGIGMGSDIPVNPKWVTLALAKGRNPIIEVLLKQPDLAREFCEYSGHEPPKASVTIDRNRRSRSPKYAADRLVGAASARRPALNVFEGGSLTRANALGRG
jgi:hypothetical protein